jgi:hypothetical protein
VTDPKEFPSDELLLTIDLVKENQKECGSSSSYTFRTRPWLNKAIKEAKKRGLI